MSGPVLFERPYGGVLWQLTVEEYDGKTRASLWPRFRYIPTGELRYGKRGSGLKMPLESLWELTQALMAFHGLEPPDAPETAS